MPELHEQIAEIEAEIVKLADAAERCRKVMLVGRLASASGGLLLAAVVAGLLPFARPFPFLIAIAAGLGGIALYGSTKTTRDQIVTEIKAREAARADMIGQLELRDLSDAV
jgi:hypothetical protein